MKDIRTQEELADLADELGLRMDWHEPDEQEISVRFEEGYGDRGFDNAMGTSIVPEEVDPWQFDADRRWEHCIVIQKAGEDIAVVNLAQVFHWATRSTRHVTAVLKRDQQRARGEEIG